MDNKKRFFCGVVSVAGRFRVLGEARRYFWFEVAALRSRMDLLQELREELGVGGIYPHGKNFLVLRVAASKDNIATVIPYFNGKLNGAVGEQFRLWATQLLNTKPIARKRTSLRGGTEVSPPLWIP